MMHQEIEDYVDNIVVKSKTRAGHFQVLERVFERCRMYKLRMNPLSVPLGYPVEISLGSFFITEA